MNKFKQPQEPNEWGDANFYLYRTFSFDNTPDIECLIRLVKEHLPNKGNSKYLRARLLGILFTQFERANSIFWIRHKHPKTWRLRYYYKRTTRFLHRLFETRTFKGQVYLCNLATECATECIKEEQGK